MKDTKLRGIVLNAFYEQRRGDMFCPTPQEFGGIMTERDIASISEQLGEHGLLNWKSIRFLDGNHTGMGRISAFGIDVVEGVATPDIKVEFVQSKTINVSGSSNVVVGNNNTMSVSGHVMSLDRAIDESAASAENKAEAKSLLKRFAEHPLVVAVAGGATGLLGS